MGKGGSIAALLAVALLATAAAARMARVPPTAELDGCVLPATACSAPRDAIEIRVDGRPLRSAVVEKPASVGPRRDS